MTREELARAMAEAALLRGEFTLRSGRTSRYYLDKYLFETRPELLREIARLFAERVREIHGAAVRGTGGDGGVDRLAGAELGGVPLATATALETGLPFVLVRSGKKAHGTGKEIEGELAPGDRVVLLEDIATTGGQALEALDSLRRAGAEVLAVIACVDRQEDARANFERAGVRFEALFTKSDLGIDEA